MIYKDTNQSLNNNYTPTWITRIRESKNVYLQRTKLTLYKNNEWYNAYEYDAIIITKLFRYRLFNRSNKLCAGFTNKSLDRVLTILSEQKIGHIILDKDEVIGQSIPDGNIYHRLIERCEKLLYNNDFTLDQYKEQIKVYHEGLRGGDLSEKSSPKSEISTENINYPLPNFHKIKLSEEGKNQPKTPISSYIKPTSEMSDDEFLEACFPKKNKTAKANSLNTLTKQILTTTPPWESKFKPSSLSVRIDDRVLLEDLSDGGQFSVTIKASTVSHVPTWFGDSCRSKYKTQTTQKIDYHTNYAKGEFSDRSPLGKAILGKSVGDIVSYKPDDSIIFQKVKILKIEAP